MKTTKQTSETQSSSIQLSSFSPTEPSRIHHVWDSLCSDRLLFSALLGLGGTWGSMALIQLWSPTFLAILFPWFVFLSFMFIVHSSVRSMDIGEPSSLVFIATLLFIYIAKINPIFFDPGHSTLGKYLYPWTQSLLQVLGLAGYELLGGILFFALLARLIDRCSLLWVTSQQPPQDALHEYIHIYPATESSSPEELSTCLHTHFDTVQQDASGLVYAERGRNAMLGEIWILLGWSMGLACIGLMKLWPQHLQWTQIILGSAPWLLIGAYLSAGKPYTRIFAWKEEGDILLWVRSDKGLAQLESFWTSWNALIQTSNSIEEESKEETEDSTVEDVENDTEEDSTEDSLKESVEG